jgi:UDP-N-acetylmuramate dehydrogenase
MPAQTGEIFQCLAAIPGLQVTTQVPLASLTRFGIGGPAAVLVETRDAKALMEAVRAVRAAGLPMAILGGGSNVVVSDEGFQGVVLRYTADRIWAEGRRVYADAGAELQKLVDFTVERGLKGLETLTRLPGLVGAAVYGNAGAYGHSISERVDRVHVLEGERLLSLDNAACEFGYRESAFKRHKNWFILSAEFVLEPADPAELRRTEGEIARIRDAKFPPTLKCAGSIFKNVFLKDLPPELAAQVPPEVVREGKVPAAWFLDQAGAKGLSRGGVRVAAHHANLIYNAGGGTASDLRALIQELKQRVRERFGIELEEEIQYVGFGPTPSPAEDAGAA